MVNAVNQTIEER